MRTSGTFDYESYPVGGSYLNDDFRARETRTAQEMEYKWRRSKSRESELPKGARARSAGADK